MTCSSSGSSGPGIIVGAAGEKWTDGFLAGEGALRRDKFSDSSDDNALEVWSFS